MPKFPEELFNASLIQNGHGDCETIAYDHSIGLHLEKGTLVLYPNGTWKWFNDKKEDE
jgi:hypothetical protein